MKKCHYRDHGNRQPDRCTGHSERCDKDRHSDPPLVLNIEEATLENEKFRTTVWTGNDLQLTLMSIKPCEDIGIEMHDDVDQFIRIEQGHARVDMGECRHKLPYQKRACDGYAILIPAGTWHNITNVGDECLKVYSLYAPPNHKRGTVHRIKADAEANEHHV